MGSTGALLFGPSPLNIGHPEDVRVSGLGDSVIDMSSSAPSSPRSRACVLRSKRMVKREIKSCPTSPTGRSKPRAKKKASAPTLLSSPESPIPEAVQESTSSDRDESKDGPLKSTTIKAIPETYPFTVLETSSASFNTLKARPIELTIRIRPPKRPRALHDVDGPGTGSLSCKKRRLRLHLITSRLSQPFSLPATHILNRESGDDTPCISRFLKVAALGAKKAGHQTALVRKAAILNRVRLRVRQAAVMRGHVEMAGFAARHNFLNHGLQVVTAPPSSGSGARFPGRVDAFDIQQTPPAWRPHTTIAPINISLMASTSPIPVNGIAALTSLPYGNDITNSNYDIPAPVADNLRPPPAPRLAPVRSPNLAPQPPEVVNDFEEDEDEMAFPASDLDSRYADLSDDDMDDVYADFSAIFGGGPGNPDSSDSEGSENQRPPDDDHFYEEYLDELDGIPWVA